MEVIVTQVLLPFFATFHRFFSCQCNLQGEEKQFFHGYTAETLEGDHITVTNMQHFRVFSWDVWHLRPFSFLVVYLFVSQALFCGKIMEGKWIFTAAVLHWKCWRTINFILISLVMCVTKKNQEFTPQKLLAKSRKKNMWVPKAWCKIFIGLLPWHLVIPYS